MASGSSPNRLTANPCWGGTLGFWVAVTFRVLEIHSIPHLVEAYPVVFKWGREAHRGATPKIPKERSTSWADWQKNMFATQMDFPKSTKSTNSGIDSWVELDPMSKSDPNNQLRGFRLVHRGGLWHRRWEVLWWPGARRGRLPAQLPGSTSSSPSENRFGWGEKKPQARRHACTARHGCGHGMARCGVARHGSHPRASQQIVLEQNFDANRIHSK